MEVLIINHHEVRELLPMGECIEAMADVFRIMAGGDVVQPLRWPLWLPDRSGLLGMMPGYVGGEMGMLGIKTVSVMPGNHGTPYDSHQGTVMLFEKVNGRLLTIMDASEITAIRTAAVSGLATRLLARDDAHDLAILGTGVQGRSHLAAMLAVRPIDRVRVWSRNAEGLANYAAWAKKTHGVEVEIMGDVQTAVSGADLICTTTAAPTPILYGEWLAPGVHINAAGSSVKHTRELDTATVVMSRLFVDRRESTVNEAGDFLFPKQEGAVDDDHIVAEIGELLMGEKNGRQTGDDITLFKSLGLAIEDIGAAHHIYEKAIAQGKGTWVELGGTKEF
ncbi:MAG: ornithine cyclodeaminase family protein [Ardenticatenaceae bacterium]|nr:ornithine cyclodeaminase family protein [Ardenticatenaceae bacterium]